jgi:DNA-binding MarR family transcriptional regulator
VSAEEVGLAQWYGPPVAGHGRGQGGATAPSFVYLLGRVDRGVRTELARRVAKWDLGVASFTTLSVLRARPGLSNAQLARRAFTSPQAINGVLSDLEQRGLVKRTVDPDRRRILRAQLTPEGTKIARAAEEAINTLQDELLEGISAQDRETMTRGLLTCMTRMRDLW